jgi:hypothetical protein
MQYWKVECPEDLLIRSVLYTPAHGHTQSQNSTKESSGHTIALVT